jgi:hypothetical protein
MASLYNNIKLEDIKNFLPAYLTDSDQATLLRNITKDYPHLDYYSLRDTQDILQGDGWTGLEIITFDTMEKIRVSGLILSNTCDIAPENPRIKAPNIIFAPVTTLQAYDQVLSANCTDIGRVRSHMEAIRVQALTNRFYLPKATPMAMDYVVLLDDIHTMPRERYLKNSSRKLCVRLSNSGFYVFILKLSIHFCRLTDGVNRNVRSAPVNGVKHP